MNMTFNKYLLAITSSAVIASPLYAATVYKTDTQEFNVGGRVEVRGVLSDGDYSDASRIRLNVDGKNKLNDNLTVFGRYEFEADENTNDDADDLDISVRHLYVGADTQVGSFIYGHQVNAVTYLTDFTDQAETFSGYVNENTITTADRAKNTLRYVYTADALTLQASATQNANSNADGYGLMAAYKFSPELELAAGVATSDQEYGNGTDTDDSTSYLLAAKYTKGSVYLSAMGMAGNISADGIEDSDFVAADAFAAYYFGANQENVVNASYSYYSADDIDALETNFVGVEYARYMGNFALFGSYKIALNNDTSSGNGRENELLVGARYGF